MNICYETDSRSLTSTSIHVLQESLEREVAPNQARDHQESLVKDRLDQTTAMMSMVPLMALERAAKAPAARARSPALASLERGPDLLTGTDTTVTDMMEALARAARVPLEKVERDPLARVERDLLTATVTDMMEALARAARDHPARAARDHLARVARAHMMVMDTGMMKSMSEGISEQVQDKLLSDSSSNRQLASFEVQYIQAPIPWSS